MKSVVEWVWASGKNVPVPLSPQTSLCSVH